MRARGQGWTIRGYNRAKWKLLRLTRRVVAAVTRVAANILFHAGSREKFSYNEVKSCGRDARDASSLTKLYSFFFFGKTRNNRQLLFAQFYIRADRQDTMRIHIHVCMSTKWIKNRRMAVKQKMARTWHQSREMHIWCMYMYMTERVQPWDDICVSSLLFYDVIARCESFANDFNALFSAESHAECEKHTDIATGILIAGIRVQFWLRDLCARMQSIISPRAKKVCTGADAPE